MRARPSLLRLSSLPLWLLMAATLPAHALYKVVGPDGRITYTDRPPTSGQGQAVPLGEAPAPSTEAALPASLRQVASRFPVTLYSTEPCQPCDAGRALLRERGVPFRERTGGETPADRQAWLQAVGRLQSPALSVGGQMLHGYAAATWNEWLDTAGYPRRSQLPANYVAPPAQPLVAPAPATPAPAATPAAPPAPAAAPEPAPGGIRF